MEGYFLLVDVEMEQTTSSKRSYVAIQTKWGRKHRIIGRI